MKELAIILNNLALAILGGILIGKFLTDISDHTLFLIPICWGVYIGSKTMQELLKED